MLAHDEEAGDAGELQPFWMHPLGKVPGFLDLRFIVPAATLSLAAGGFRLDRIPTNVWESRDASKDHSALQRVDIHQ